MPERDRVLSDLVIFSPFQNARDEHMGEGWEIFPTFRDVRSSIAHVVGEEGVSKWVRQTALYSTVMGMYKTLMLPLEGVQEDISVGHSMGEHMSLTAKGALDLPTGARILQARETLIEEASEAVEPKNGMYSLMVDPAQKKSIVQLIQELSGKVYLANDNSPSQLVISAVKDQISLLERKLTNFRVRLNELGGIIEGYHSPLMSPIEPYFQEALRKITGGVVETPGKRVFSPIGISLDLPWLEEGRQAYQILEHQLTTGVSFSEACESIAALGPKLVLILDPSGKMARLVSDNFTRVGVVNKINPDLNEGEADGFLNITSISTPESLIRAWRAMAKTFDLDLKFPATGGLAGI